MNSVNASDYFPADSFRKHQKKVVETVIQKIEDPTIDNIIVIAPVGFGKSAVNIAACNYVNSAFYVTPQKSLRQQLVNDDITGPHVTALKARNDYTCQATGQNCSSCKIRNDEDRSCMTTPGCTYWNAKDDAMNSQTAALTFAYLVVDNYLPLRSEGGEQISFSNRDLVVVDEAHSLEQDTASMFAGQKLTPHTLPRGIYLDWAPTPMGDSFELGELISEFKDLRFELKRYVEQNSTWGNPNPSKEVEQCRKVYEKLDYAIESHFEGKEWVVNKQDMEYNNRLIDTFELKPVNVAPFLERNVWGRGSNRLISTATVPYRHNVDLWCYRVGLDPDRTFALFVPMEFPVENRPIHTDCMIDKMSGGTDEERIDDIMDEMARITADHAPDKGLVHTNSYERAEMILKHAQDYDELQGNILMQTRESDKETLLEDWYEGGEQLLLSPSMEEGVDLVGDRCRFQICVKVPYPSPGDARVEKIMDKDGGWSWYYETTGLKISQAYGRAVRSKTDHADFYMLDESFNDVRREVTLPDWLTEAIL